MRIGGKAFGGAVRAGMVKRAWEYPWSSAKFHIGEQKVDVLVKDRDLLGLVAN